MAEKKDRECVIAEITLSHLIRLGNEQGSPVSRQQALAFLNQEGLAFEMWKQMMQAAEEFVTCSLLEQRRKEIQPATHSNVATKVSAAVNARA